MPYRKSFSAYYLQLAIFLIALAARLIPGPRTIDDAYISFRYARNILAGNGFVYNPGERVLGTTTPFYTILLTTVGSFSKRSQVPFPEIAWVINSIADAFGCILLYSLGLKFNKKFAALGAALAWSIAPYSVTFAIGGLETSVYVLIILATIYAYINEKTILTSLLCALMFLTRPDALILILLLMVGRFSTMVKDHQLSIGKDSFRKISWEIIGFTIPVFSWLAFGLSYFGSPLPHSIAAKTLAYRLPQYDAFIRLIQHYATPFQGDLTFGVKWIAIGMILYPFLFLVGSRQMSKPAVHILPVLLYPWAYFLVFSIANPLIFRWYLTPPLPIYILIILIGLESLISNLAVRLDLKRPTQIKIINGTSILLVIMAPLALLLHGWTLTPDHGLKRPAPVMAWIKLELLYREAADFLSPKMQEWNQLPLLAAGDVGVLGYFTHTQILDTVGLNSPQSLAYYPLESKYYVGNYAIPPDLVLDWKPDYLVILEVYGRQGLLKDSRFQSSYNLLKVIPTNIYGSQGMLIYQRNAGQ